MLYSFLYVAFIVLADVLAARWILPLPFGLSVPAGVFAIAPIFTLRDELHRERGARYVTVLIFIASALSYGASVLLGNALLGQVTLASVAAFLVSENADTLVYALLHKQTFMRRVLASNAVSTLLDSGIFITLAFGWLPGLIVGQYLFKMFLAGATGVVLNWQHQRPLEKKSLTP